MFRAGRNRSSWRIGVGDLVTTVGPDGVAAAGKVASVFVTRNRLVELRTETGILLTTATQPFSLRAVACGPPAN